MARAVAVVAAAALLNGCIVAGVALVVAASRKHGDAAAAVKVVAAIRPQFDTRDQGPHDAAFDKAMTAAGDAAAMHWDNPATGDSGAITAAAPEAGADGQTCRQVVESYVRAGKTYDGTGRFCGSGAAGWQAAAL